MIEEMDLKCKNVKEKFGSANFAPDELEAKV